MKVSIIICTHNRSASLKEMLDSLARVDVPADLPVELLVVDNASTDDTRQITEAFMPNGAMSVRYCFEPRKGKSKALNTGLNLGGGDIFLFTDDDVRFPANWIEEMCRPVVEGKADVVQGGVRWAPHLLKAGGPSSYLPSIITSTAHKSQEEISTGLIGANMGFARRVYESIGAFDEELGPGALGLGEETLYGWQSISAGFRKLNVLHVEVEHHFDSARLSRSGLLELADRKGRSAAYIDFHWKHSEEKWVRCRILALVFKDLIRTICTPAAWPWRASLPEWKYSYKASTSRLQQMLQEMKRNRKYSFKGLRKLQ